jgi:rhamnogalacturonyl hydrolase YesR
MKVLDNGKLVVEGPTTQAQPMPSGITESGVPASPIKPKGDEVFNKRYIKKTLQLVTDWQLNHPKHAPTDWTNGAFYAGVVAAYKTTGSKKILDSLMALGQRTAWQPGRKYDHADDIAIAQTYIDLYRKKGDKAMIRAIIDTVQKLRTVPGNESKKGLMWWWCDALFMGPPVIVKLGVTLKDPSYFALNDSLFRQTYDLLYNKEQQLFARDASYLIKANGEGKREANGQPIFWSRGNGWVMGGLVRILEELPKNYPTRSFYEQLFKDMSAKIITLQQADGLWRASLLDPVSYPGGEGSGTGFYCYALAWGVNHGLLDKATYAPVVRKAWEGLNTLVSEDGRVGWVQPIGADPKKNFNAESYEVYGAGAFLLAGSEIIKLR